MLAKMRREPALDDLLNDPIVRLVMKPITSPKPTCASFWRS
jgi:hypothetical protein